MKASLLKIGLVVIISGMIWTSVVFLQAEKTTDNIELQTNHSKEISLEFIDTGIGYYKIYFPQYLGNEVFVQILDNKNNIISEKMIETKMSVNYFDYSNGQHTVKLSNLNEEKTILEIEFGSTNSEQLVYPGTVMIAGMMILLVAVYIRMKNYKMAQPDEKIG